MKLQQTQQIIISKRHKFFPMLDMLCFKSKNLYNYALYQIRQHYENTSKYLSYFELNKMLSSSNQNDYRSLPYAQCSQQILRQIDKQYVSFYKAIRSVKMKGKKVRIPKFKDKENGRNEVVYTNQCFKFKDNNIVLKLDTDTKINIPTDKNNVQQVRIIPKGNHYVIEIIYNVEYTLKEDIGCYAAIDLGVSNLATVVSNKAQSIIIDGRKIKSINQYYNKTKSNLQSLLKGKRQTSKRIKNITYRRNNKIKDYMHKATTKIIEYMEANSLTTLIVGKNVG